MIIFWQLFQTLTFLLLIIFHFVENNSGETVSPLKRRKRKKKVTGNFKKSDVILHTEKYSYRKLYPCISSKTSKTYNVKPKKARDFHSAPL